MRTLVWEDVGGCVYFDAATEHWATLSNSEAESVFGEGGVKEISTASLANALPCTSIVWKTDKRHLKLLGDVLFSIEGISHPKYPRFV